MSSGTQSLGILGMRQRALLIDAEFEITAVAGEGTLIILWVTISRKRA